MATFYIDEIQNRPDGVTNCAATVTRSTLGNALAYYYQRKSALSASTEFVSYGLGLRCSDGRQVEPWEVVECTEYVASDTTEET